MRTLCFTVALRFVVYDTSGVALLVLPLRGGQANRLPREIRAKYD